jgi:hypothetical protein
MEHGRLYDSGGLTASDLSQSAAHSRFGQNDESRSFVIELEKKLAKEKEQRIEALHCLDDAKEELDRINKKLRNANESLAQKDKQIREMEEKLASISRGNAQRIELISFENELSRRDNEIKELKEQVKTRDKALESTSTSHFIEQTRVRDLQSQLASLETELKLLREKARQGERDIDKLYLDKKSEGTVMLEVEHYRADNARLIQLLKQTDEFKDFAEYAEDSKGMRYLPLGNAPPPKIKKPCTTCKAANEVEEWVPAEAFHIAHNFAAKYGNSGFTQAQINKLLSQINAIWRQREKNQVSRFRSKCLTEVRDLRRQLAMQKSYDHTVGENEIKRLRGDLRKAHENVRTASSTGLQGLKRPWETELLKYELQMKNR